MTWLDLPEGTGFGIENLPLGVFSTPHGPRRTGIAVGDSVLDLAGLTEDPLHRTGSLNAFLSLGPAAWRELREQVTGWLTHASHRRSVEGHLLPRDEVTMHLPIAVADYVDFYSSRQHAENVGRLFRPDAEPLAQLPVGRYRGSHRSVPG